MRSGGLRWQLGRPWRFLRKSDWLLLLIATLLAMVGIAMQWSISGVQRFPEAHVLRLGVAVVAGCFAAAWGGRRWRNSSIPIYVICLGLLILVLVIGRTTNNARRWIDLFSGFKLQPSEVAKLGLMLMLARWFGDRPRPETFKALLGPAALTAVPAVMVMLQPDLGTALTFGPMFLGMAWLAGAPWKNLKWFLLVPLMLAPFAVFGVEDYQLKRIDIWWRQDSLSTEEKADAGYHLWHSKLAIGTGGTWGTGWAQGPENQLDRLPERHNDFIFPVIAEEQGFVGGAGFLLLYGWLVLAAFAAARRYRDPFSRFVIAGVGLHFAIHLLLNVAVTLGVVPTTGLPLPLVSWGGTSMLVSGLLLGMALAIGASKGPVFSNRAFEE
ncbi:MAG: hypothetical protein COB96_02050 [Planctomycetota bacterium]|nr:MAG: hypothetical protein COB96_02050 [Planctomycetota bacterium]